MPPPPPPPQPSRRRRRSLATTMGADHGKSGSGRVVDRQVRHAFFFACLAILLVRVFWSEQAALRQWQQHPATGRPPPATSGGGSRGLYERSGSSGGSSSPWSTFDDDDAHLDSMTKVALSNLFPNSNNHGQDETGYNDGDGVDDHFEDNDDDDETVQDYDNKYGADGYYRDDDDEDDEYARVDTTTKFVLSNLFPDPSDELEEEEAATRKRTRATATETKPNGRQETRVVPTATKNSTTGALLGHHHHHHHPQSNRHQPQLVQNTTATTTTAAATLSNDNIRSWGCHRIETPLIFVHIGKAGGGSVRARFAAAALDYDRPKWQSHREDKTYYYPIPATTATTTTTATGNVSSSGSAATIVKGYFCNSAVANYRVLNEIRSYEGTHPCDAQTPLGMALACPMGTDRYNSRRSCKGCGLGGDTCHRVYVGHNKLGGEMHWLPFGYLRKWWNATILAESSTATETEAHSKLGQTWQLLRPHNKEWCPAMELARPKVSKMYKAKDERYEACTVPLAERVDALANTWMKGQTPPRPSLSTASGRYLEAVGANRQWQWWPSDQTKDVDASLNWGPLYASLPLLRTTVVREPFSWLLSKFFWHGETRKNHDCGNASMAAIVDGRSFIELYNETRSGWATRAAMVFIYYLCGEDCRIRHELAATRMGANYTAQHEQFLLNAFERQADYNLRNSFAVVGLNNDTQEFYDMVSARVHYIDMSRNLHVKGQRHSSRPSRDCKEIFQNPDFQEQLIRDSPAIAAMTRLYHTAVEVNAFQKQELASCSAA